MILVPIYIFVKYLLNFHIRYDAESKFHMCAIVAFAAVA